MVAESWGKRVWRFFWPLFLIWAAVAAVVALSFLVLAGGFTWRSFSDRLFWGGIAVTVVGGFVIFGVLGYYSTLGTPSVLTASGDARIAHERIREYIKTNSGRYMFSFRMFLVGAMCIGTSALVEVLSR